MHVMNIVVIAVAALLGAAAGRQLHAHVRQLARRVHEDPLTAVLNRSGLAHAYATSADRDRYLILIDLDAFKQANDRHGHPAGDQVLAAVGSRLTTIASRLGGWAGRLGGDEFALILPTASAGVAGVAAAEACAPFLIPDLPTGPLSVSGTAGIAYARTGYLWPRVLTDADIALYQAKRVGTPVVYQPGMTYPGHAWQLRRQARDAAPVTRGSLRQPQGSNAPHEPRGIADLLSDSDLECLVKTAVDLWNDADRTALSERQKQVLQRACDAMTAEYAGAGDTPPLAASAAPTVWVLRRWSRHDDVVTLHTDENAAFAALAEHVRSSWANLASGADVPPEPPGNARQAVEMYYGPDRDGQPDEGFSIYPDQIGAADQPCPGRRSAW